MSKLGAYKVDLKGMEGVSNTCKWSLDNDFFTVVDSQDLQRGKLEVELTVEKAAGLYNLFFNIKGHVTVTCDRCLDDMSQLVETTGELKVKLGSDFADDGNVVVVPEEDGTVNVAWFIYEFITLAIPLKHVHAPGKCNKEMMDQLQKHSQKESGDEEEGGASPWEALKGFAETDND